MIRQYAIILCSLFLCTATAQSWCPPGAQWHVSSFGYMMSGYIHYVYEGDTFIHGRMAQKISREGYQFVTFPVHHQFIISGHTYTALEDDVLLVPVYLSTENWVWDTLVWFGAEIGDRWYAPGDDGTCGPSPAGMFQVTDTSTTIIDGIPLRTRHIIGLLEGGTPSVEEFIFTERLGLLHTFSHLMPPCIADGPGVEVIRCYSDDQISYVSPSWYGPCELGLSMEDGTTMSRISIHPNPGTDHFTLQLPPGPHHLTLFDAQGRQVLRQQLSEERPVISTASLPPGIYHIHITDRYGRISGQRWVKH
jgi:hypothetical protein